MTFGFSVLNVPVASLLQNFEGFLAFGVMSRWRNSLPEDVILYIHHTSHSRTGLGMKNIYETANWSLRQGDEGVNKRIKQKNIFFWLLLHRPAVTISLTFHIYSSYHTDPGLQLGDRAPLIGLLLWTFWHFIYLGTKATGDSYHDWLQAAHSNQHLTNQRQAFIFKNTDLINRWLIYPANFAIKLFLNDACKSEILPRHLIFSFNGLFFEMKAPPKTDPGGLSWELPLFPGQFFVCRVGADTELMFIQGGSAPRSNPLPPFIYHFSRKRYPFRIPSIDKWYRCHVPCWELCIPFNCCKCTIHVLNRNQS